ncbi:MAG: biosynthetic-type acetolactate synthase large subunit [Gemmatales bacterium]|nr:biosynthetic-type acetolactate synthase large subunit [Gemmatales bacterium]MDW8386467.1 biosynthetic-type acetolactate synthase large subunit [Gemmatales bacterium]
MTAGCPSSSGSSTIRHASGADLLVECLVRNGVEVVFAYPGGASMPIHQALTRWEHKIRTILPRHEQGGGFMAEGYARSTGRVGVCIATSGPGATNFVTCLADAKMDSVPLVAITGQVPTPVIGTDAFQETPIVEICRSITKHHYLVTRTEDIPRVVKEAFYVASTGRPGPVLIDLPKDVQNRCITADLDPPINLPGYRPHRRAKREELLKVMELIRQSRKPIIYAGGGIIHANAGHLLRAFAEKTCIPVALTLMGLGSFPSSHYLCLQMLGMHGTVYANYAINEADLLLALGVRFDDRVTGKVSEFCKHGKIVHIDIDPAELNKCKPALVPIAGDVGLALQDMLEMVEQGLHLDPGESPGGKHADWLRQIEYWRETEPLSYRDRDDAILAQYAIERLWQIIRDRGQLRNTIITTGVGQHQMWAAQYYRFEAPRTWFTSGGLGAMGFGLPAAIGAKAACPDKTVIDIDGDGSFLMNIQELATAYVEKLPVKVLLLNNQHLGMVVQWEDRFYQSNRAHTYLGAGPDEDPYPDFVKLAHGFRCGAKSVREKADLDEAIEEMLDATGPYVLEVMVPYQEHVLPMIPSGHTVRDIIKA